MKYFKTFLAFCTVALISVPSCVWAAEFNVSNVGGFQQALIDATKNSENDTINVAAGIYDVSGGTLMYTPGDTGSGFGDDNHALSLQGSGAASTLLDGGNVEQILHINTYDLSSDKNAHIILRDMTFQNGQLSGVGAGLHCKVVYADITVEDSRFTHNTTGDGGGVWAWTTNGDITFINNTFTDNTAYDKGGGAYAWSNYTVNFTNNTFNGNSANDGGGAYASSTGTIQFTNNTFNDNSANDGGGSYANSNVGSIDFKNNTFNGNFAEYRGGGLFVWLYSDSASASIYNNILWGNTAGIYGYDLYVQDDVEANGTGAEVYLFYNDVNSLYIYDGDHLSQGNNICQNPLFTADLHIHPTSPCINKGIYQKRVWIDPPGTWIYYNYGVPELDQDGDSRESDWIEETANNYYKYCDIGADEYTSNFLPCIPLLLLNK